MKCHQWSTEMKYVEDFTLQLTDFKKLNVFLS